MEERGEFLVLGGGVAGLAAGVELGERAIVLERESRPGGLVVSDEFEGYWFDRVLHLLHFPDEALQRRIQEIVGDDLAPCPPVAWIECAGGNVRYPFQLNVGGLEEGSRNRCLADFARASFGADSGEPPADYEDLLVRAFGREMCEQFFLPYNRKMWRRPLRSLAPMGFVWNIHRPSFEEVLDGAFRPNLPRETYNTRAFYPRPPAGAPVRGMEVLSRSLAARVPRLRLDTEVLAIDPRVRTVSARHEGRELRFGYDRRCLSTMPLPQTMRACAGAPEELVRAAEALPRNVVFSVAFAIRGPRPAAPGHWRYHTDERVPFTRLVYMAEFDPLTAPADGWGLMAEVTHPAEEPWPGEEELCASARDGLRRVGALGEGQEIVAERVFVADPAYVVFTPESREVVRRCTEYLAAAGVDTVGRYGRWEYSSMAQVMADGFRWAAEAAAP
jgi:protoporphyrinogen oxidase